MNGSNKEPPKGNDILPLHIDYCNYPGNGGVWYPDEYFKDGIVSLLWKEDTLDSPVKGSYCNPFLVDKYMHQIGLQLTQKFIEDESKCLNWALVQTGLENTLPERSNISIANQDKGSVPKWLSKPEYLTFCSIRSYPLQQIRKICSVLHDKSLPLNHKGNEIGYLIKQALFHIGDINVNKINDKDYFSPFYWKGDFMNRSTNNESWLKRMENELFNLTDTYKNSPNEIYLLLLIGELAGFISQWSKSTGICKIISDAMISFSNDIGKNIMNIEKENEIIEIRRKQSLFNMIGIHVYSLIDIDNDDAKKICKMNVMAKNLLVDDNNHLFELEFRCKSIISTLSTKIKKYIDEDKSILTECINLVTSNCPNNLEWEEILPYSCSFEAINENNDHYSINILSGIVLINGKPPSNLSMDIRNHIKYKKVFGSRNFETVLNSGGGFITRYPLNGNMYSFFLDSKKSLVIKEINCETKRELELLDLPITNDDINDWSNDLPIRLRMMHSHWLYISNSMDGYDFIVFRGIGYKERKISFIAKYIEKRWQIYRIPYNLQDFNVEELIAMIDNEKDIVEVMINVDMEKNRNIIHVIEKFEDRKFIEVYNDNIENIKVSFPRYQRDFEIRDNKLYSVDYSDYYLASCQQFDDCFYRFNQYLILEQDHGIGLKIIIPVCEINMEKGNPCLMISDKYDEKLEEYAYDIHSRLKIFKASSIASRLHLAAIFSSINTKLPEKRYGMTGEEVAIELIRQSWINRPLKKEENNSLNQIVKVSSYSCTILLLCKELRFSSSQCNFLHLKGSEQIISECESSIFETEYKIKDALNWNPRCFLTSQEELRILGSISSSRFPQQRDITKINHMKIIEISNFYKSYHDEIYRIEDILESMIQFLLDHSLEYDLILIQAVVSMRVVFVLRSTETCSGS